MSDDEIIRERRDYVAKVSKYVRNMSQNEIGYTNRSKSVPNPNLSKIKKMIRCDPKRDFSHRSVGLFANNWDYNLDEA